ncbi:hypothetical protein DIPPA_15974 [Diplonema papillatum]|nr:hypothetical protein DIPPA_15974 [Diplonema papillatum]
MVVADDAPPKEGRFGPPPAELAGRKEEWQAGAAQLCREVCCIRVEEAGLAGR